MKKFINTISKAIWVLYFVYVIFMVIAFVAGCVKVKKDKRKQAEDKEEMIRKEFDEEFERDIEEMKKRRDEYIDTRENISSNDPKRERKNVFAELDERLKKNREDMREAFEKAGWDYVCPQGYEKEE